MRGVFPSFADTLALFHRKTAISGYQTETRNGKLLSQRNTPTRRISPKSIDFLRNSNSFEPMTRSQLFPIILCSSLITISIAAAFDAPADWRIAGPFGGTATSLALDPQKPNFLLAGGMNSLLFRSEDAGETWSLLDFPKHNLTEVTSVLVDPSDSNHFLAGIISADGGAMYASHDRGKNWKAVSDVKDFGVRSIVAAPSKPTRFIAGTLRGVWMSEDSGAHWERISDPKNLEMGGITATAIDPKDPDIMYAGTSHLPWKSTDGGKTWKTIHTGMTDDSDVFSIYINPADPNNIFASACSGIYTSGDRGDQWKKVMGLTFSQRRTHVIRKDPQADGLIYAGTTMGLFKSPNMGSTWKLLSKEQVNAIVFDPANPGSMYMAMEYEGLGRASDAGEKIHMLNHGFVDRTISGVTTAGDKLIAIETQLGESSGIFVSKDKGESWSQIMDVKGLNAVHLHTIAAMPSEERIMLASAAHEIYKTVDGGQIWKPLPLKLVTPVAEKAAPATVSKTTAKRTTAARKTVARKPVENVRVINPHEIHGIYSAKNGTKDLLFAATDLGLLRSSDAGERWTMAEVAGSSGVTGLYVSPINDGRMVARADAGLYVSKDFGDHWTNLNFPTPTADVKDVAVPVEPGAPLLVATRLGMFSSDDDGAKWAKDHDGLPASTVNSVVYGSGTIAYAVQYGKLFETKDAGKSWSHLKSALPPAQIRKLWIPDLATNRLFGISADLGVLFRN
jgi:photosystem II stability/assembly factor-like uncharacterized protein